MQNRPVLQSSLTDAEKSPERDLTDYIRYNEKAAHLFNPLWRSNRNDPYIYISFSLKLFMESNHFKLAGANELFGKLQLKEFEPQIVAAYKNIIRKEWQCRAQLTMIKFLDDDSFKASFKDKNLYFIFNELDLKPGNGVTSHFERLKISRLPSVLQQLTEQDIYALLHETAHAFHFKHFRFYEYIADRPPYVQGETGKAELDCTKTVMAYDHDCPLVYPHFPTQLGPIDLVAAQKFNLFWHKLNKKIFFTADEMLPRDDHGFSEWQGQPCDAMLYPDHHSHVYESYGDTSYLGENPLSLQQEKNQYLPLVKNSGHSLQPSILFLKSIGMLAQKLPVGPINWITSSQQSESFPMVQSSVAKEPSKKISGNLPLSKENSMQSNHIQPVKHHQKIGYFFKGKNLIKGATVATTSLVLSSTPSSIEKTLSSSKYEFNINYHLLVFLAASSATIVLVLMYFIYRSLNNQVNDKAYGYRG